jgi:hypothetical protein
MDGHKMCFLCHCGVGTLTARIFHGWPQNVLPILCSLRCVNGKTCPWGIHSSQQWNVVFCPCYLADSFIQLLPKGYERKAKSFTMDMHYVWQCWVCEKKMVMWLTFVETWTLYVFQNLDLGFVKYLLGRKAVKSVSEIILTSAVQSVAQQ